MKILQIIASTDPTGGGPIESVYRLGRALRDRGHRQDLLTLDPPMDGNTDGPAGSVFARGRAAPMGAGAAARLRRWARYSPEALAWAKRHVGDYDLVVVNGLWNYSTHLARRVLVGGGVPYVVYSHGMLDPWFRRTYRLKHIAKQALWLWNEGVLIRHASAVAFTCEQEREIARTFKPWRARERVVPFGTADVPADMPELHAAFARAVPAINGRRYLLFISRLHRKKGVDLLVEAFARLAASAPDLDLVIAGPDEDHLTARLEAMAERMGVAQRVHLVGMLTGDAKWGAFHGCEAFVLPSHSENFGIVVAEALAARKPVLISDKINIWKEVDGARAGLIATDTVDGAERLIRGFLAMSSSERLAMGERGRALFLDRFEIGRAADGFVEMARDLIRLHNDNQTG